jgi:two-component system sensor histidine kinase YesM
MIGKNAEGALRWVPTYRFINIYNEEELNDSNLEYKYLFSAVKIINNLNPDNIRFEKANVNEGKPLLIINFKPTLFNEVVENSNKYKDSKYYVFSKEGNVIYSTDMNDLADVKMTKWLQEITKNKSGKIIREVDGKKSILCFDTMESTGWISVSIVPVSSILDGLANIRYFIICLGIGLIVISSICAHYISKSITKPIDKLLVAIKKMGQGNFHTKVKVKRNDEIGNLIMKFNEMDSKILNLIEENYLSRIREKEATIMALNIQLNPHFLYNTLNIINWIAIEKEEKEISKMIVNLSSMLQYTAHNNEEISDFKTDLDWLKKYIFIMQNRFEDKFEVQYEIDKEMDLYKVPKLFLQPFVENAIIHGFESIETGGMLKIKGKVIKSNACFIIEDNGKGMSQEKIEEIMGKSTKRIGISNVNSRIQLMYGEKYGVYIKSQENLGTKIIIKLPLKEKT